MSEEKKKKKDWEAIASPLNRIPGIDLATVRDLLDLGYHQIDELRGRSPEALFDQILSRREQTPGDRLPMLRMIIYYCEVENPDPARLHPWAWKDGPRY